jgi:6-phosphogluconolactonase
MSDSDDRRRVFVKASVAQATHFVAELFQSIICEAVSQRGTCSVALAGGTTPHALYHLMAFEGAIAETPWPSVEFFFGDERDVPLDHVESNFGMAQRTMLDHVPVDPSRVHPMRGDAPDLAAAAAEYEQTIRRVVPECEHQVPCFDIILLGMGSDGHTASLFPGTDAVNETEKLVVANYVPTMDRWRMTITYPLINHARNVIFLVTGQDKAEAVAKLIRQGPAAETGIPAARVQPLDGLCFVVLDPPAAKKTDRQPEV